MKARDPIVLLAGLSGALSVVAGAYGAHGATGLAAELLRTGSQYQLAHAIAALVAIGLVGSRAAGWCLLAGGGLFGVSLYALAFGGPHLLGIVTPFGGLLMIVGWLWLAFAGWRKA